jgi:hypothetical protein
MHTCNEKKFLYNTQNDSLIQRMQVHQVHQELNEKLDSGSKIN